MKKFQLGTSQNTTCYILGNGPSLRQTLEKYSDLLATQEVICVNYFISSPAFEQIKPKHYVLNAPEFWVENPPTEEHIQARTLLFKNIKEKTLWPMTIYIPFGAKKSTVWKGLFTENKNINIHYYNSTPVEGFAFFIHFLFKYNMGMPRPHNVLIPAIFISLNLGFKKLLIFGADHSWHEEIRLDDQNKMTVNHEHFYDAGKQTGPMTKMNGAQFKIHDLLRKLHLAFKGYFVLNDYAQYRGAKIYNASEKSYIDAFEKVKI